MRRFLISVIVTTIIATLVLSACVFAEDFTYKYSADFAPLSEFYSQDFEEVEVSEDFVSADYPTFENGHVYGFFSFLHPGSPVKITDQNPITGTKSIVFKDFLDTRTWMIHAVIPFDSSAYAMEFSIRVDSMPENGGRFALKITDINSAERDNEDSSNPILYIQKVEGKLGLYNLSNKLLAELEVGKAYSIVVACDLETTDYYVFLDGNYIPESHSEFNVEFAQLSAFRFDILGEGIQVTLDDLCIDGCLIKRIATATPTPAPTQAPTTAPTQAPTAAPTQAPAEEGGCGSSAAVVQIMLILGTALIIKKRK